MRGKESIVVDFLAAGLKTTKIEPIPWFTSESTNVLSFPATGVVDAAT